MNIIKSRLKQIIKEELSSALKEGLGMYQHVPDEPISGDLLGQLEEIVEMWAAETPEGRAQEKQMIDLISRFSKPEQEYGREMEEARETGPQREKARKSAASRRRKEREEDPRHKKVERAAELHHAKEKEKREKKEKKAKEKKK